MQCREFATCAAVSSDKPLTLSCNASTELMRVHASVALVGTAKRPRIVCPTARVLDRLDDRYSARSQSDNVGAPSGTHDCPPARHARAFADV